MVTSWRIVKVRHSETPFDGERARLLGGRWNTPGIRVVYTSASAALAALEGLVHLNPQDPYENRVLLSGTFDERLVTALPLEALPENWRVYPAPANVQAIGEKWVNAGTSAVLRVPSVIVPTEWNYLLNPEHPDFDAIVFGVPIPFQIDQRLLS